MAAMVGKHYATGQMITVAVDENGIVQTASSTAPADVVTLTELQQQIQLVRDDIAALSALVSSICGGG